MKQLTLIKDIKEDLEEASLGYSLALLYGDEKDMELAHMRLSGTLSRMLAHGVERVGIGNISVRDALINLAAQRSKYRSISEGNLEYHIQLNQAEETA